MCARAHALVCRYMIFAYSKEDEYIMSLFCFNGRVAKRIVKYLSNEYGPIFAQTIGNRGG